MSKFLVVVESPAKARTIEKYLGRDYKVMASYGHVRDLIPKEGAVDVHHNFEMNYQAIDRNIRYMDEISKALKTSDALFLATDPDREGEAIAWHIKEMLTQKKQFKNKPISRIVFHQITKRAVQEALEHPREISMDLVNAQQARRALDYLVGFNLSPLLWRKIRPGLSAGRVQSPALRMIAEREIEIENFKTQEYWTIHANLKNPPYSFSARLLEYNGEKVEQFTFVTEQQTLEACQAIKNAANGVLTVTKIQKKERKRYPSAPFTTSTLQQESVRKLGFSTQRTMQIAQQLYEGVDIGDEGRVGLITYMRTDSVTLAREAIDEIRECVIERYGKQNLPEHPRVYKSKSKNTQEAHEAVRPTSAFRAPDDLKKYLTLEQLKLYTLIWKRTIASQMMEATLHTVSVDLSTSNSIFRANGSTIISPGFISVYQEERDENKKPEEDEDTEGKDVLPALKEHEIIPIDDIKGEQHFTEPPPRYTEASLVKALEEYDIGRPSTYASIIATLKNRKYANLENKRFFATDVGRVVNRFLTTYFAKYVDYQFTAQLEDELDDVSRGEKALIPVLSEFWSPFKTLIDHVEKTVKRSDVTQEKMNEKCPKCGEPLSIRLGKRGRFVGCTAYPNCDYTRNLNENATQPEVLADRACPKCQAPLVIKSGRYGKFIGCSSYPTCNHMEPLEKPKDTGVVCPHCKKGTILQRKSRRGKIFYSCSRYPQCTYALWNEPIAEPCPKCGWPILSLKITKRHGTQKVCPQKDCNYLEDA